jgi:catechol 2,3-dioxygenase-like lactoylglutathione lyase family enzyme
MQVINKLTMLYLPVSDMQKAKEFYSDKIGLKVVQDYRQDDNNWWVSLILPEGGVTITLSTHHGKMKPGNATMYFATPDVTAAHRELGGKDVKASEVKDDLYGPGSGVKWFNLDDPDGNTVFLAQA